MDDTYLIVILQDSEGGLIEKLIYFRWNIDIK